MEKNFLNHFENTFVVNCEKNWGKAEAVRIGVLKAIELKFHFIGYWDADLATPLSLIGEILDCLQSDNIEIVFGSRVKLLGHKIKRSTLRHYFGRIFATFISISIGIPIYDTQCGAKVFTNNIEFQKVFSFPFSVNWTFDVEIISRYLILEKIGDSQTIKNKTIEYPLQTWADIPGSKVKIKDFFIGMFELIRIHRNAKKIRYCNMLK